MGLIKKLLFVFVLLVLIVLISSSALAKDFGKVKLNNVYADVEFLEDVSDSSKDVSELKQKIEVSPNSVNIDTKKYPNLNKKAKITFKNSYFKGTPLVIYNNQISQVTPTMVGLGQWQITVDGFSSWQLIDSSWGGTFTGGTSQNNYSWGNITHDSLMLQGDSKVSINMSMPTSGGGIKDLSFYYRNVSVSGATYYQTTNPLSRTAGSYKFDGINDAMNIQWHGALDFYGKDITIGAWINISKNSYNTITVVSSVGMPSTAGSGWIIYEQDSGSGYVLGFTHTDGGEHDSFSSQSIEFDKWNYWIFQYNISSETGRSCINNNCTIWTQSNAAILAPDTTGIWNIGRRTSGSQRNMNGSITEYRAWNRLLQPKEFANMYNNSHYYRFLANGSYITIEHNATDYTENQVNVWTNISIQNLKTIRAEQVAVYGRAGTCGALSGAWTEGTPYLAGHFTFSGGLQGKCFEANITISSYGTNLSSVWSNYTINSTKYVMPNATNLNISGGDNTSTNITGNATYSLNDTDGGGILQIGWYVNGVLNSRENFTGLSNGSISVFSLDNSNFVKNDIVNYNVTPFNSLATGNIIQSSFITIGNANFSYSYTPNNTDTISLQKPLGRAFTITFLSDVDNDAEVTWYVDGTQQTVADTFTLRSGLYGDYDILSIVANVSDGHNNMTTSWKVDLTPASVQMVGSIAIALFILFVTGGLFLLPFKKKFSDNHISDMILKRGCWTIGIYLMMLNASIMATIASSSGIDLTQEMFRYMWLFGWAGWLFIGFTVLKTLFDVIKMWKVDKENKRMGG